MKEGRSLANDIVTGVLVALSVWGIVRLFKDDFRLAELEHRIKHCACDANEHY